LFCETYEGLAVNRPIRSISRVSLSLLISAMLCLSVGVAGASAANPIEGVWSFNGGAVDVSSQPDGSFLGVVSVQTKFADCFHTVNEPMWFEIHQQSDDSYWGFHRWYFEPTAESPGCTANPEPGPTAWRVLHNSHGESFLRVCFSSPGGGSQPTIAPDGTSANVNYGCVDSGAIGALPVVSGKEGASAPKPGEISFEKSIVLPQRKQCVRSNALKIGLRNAKYDPFKELQVKVNGKRVLDVRGTKKLKKAVVLRHLPNGSYTIKVVATTVLNQRLSGSRSYHSCAKGSDKIKLHRVKRHKAKKPKK
jgi:hypothetical protein